MFVWDEKKRRKVIKDHGVDFALVFDVFEDAFGFDFVDHEHSDEKETRYGLVGLSAQYGLILIVYSIVDDDDVRLITSRKAEKWMVSLYEKNRRRF